MLKALKRIIAWTGPYRRNLYLGCVCSFFMTWATAAPVMLAAWMLAQVVDDARGVSTLDPSAVWLSLAAIVACIAARFAFCRRASATRWRPRCASASAPSSSACRWATSPA